MNLTFGSKIISEFKIAHCYLQPNVANINFLRQQMKEEFVILAYLGKHLTKV